MHISKITHKSFQDFYDGAKTAQDTKLVVGINITDIQRKTNGERVL